MIDLQKDYESLLSASNHVKSIQNYRISSGFELYSEQNDKNHSKKSSQDNSKCLVRINLKLTKYSKNNFEKNT